MKHKAKYTLTYPRVDQDEPFEYSAKTTYTDGDTRVMKFKQKATPDMIDRSYFKWELEDTGCGYVLTHQGEEYHFDYSVWEFLRISLAYDNDHLRDTRDISYSMLARVK